LKTAQTAVISGDKSQLVGSTMLKIILSGQYSAKEKLSTSRGNVSEIQQFSRLNFGEVVFLCRFVGIMLS